jgi:Adenomatosis polyposis coli down-regulated 1
MRRCITTMPTCAFYRQPSGAIDDDMQVLSFSSAVLSLTLGTALAACGGTQTPGSDTEGDPVNLTGTWSSACTVASPQQVFKLSFTFDSSSWKLDYDAFGDAACTARFLTVHVEGAYQLTGPSPTVDGASQARFAFAKKSIQPHSSEAAAFLSSAAGCNRAGFVAGVATDVLTQGCAGLGLYPLAACPAELDLAKRSGDSLRLGLRPADGNLCSEDRRPAALSPVELTRQSS